MFSFSHMENDSEKYYYLVKNNVYKILKNKKVWYGSSISDQDAVSPLQPLCLPITTKNWGQKVATWELWKWTRANRLWSGGKPGEQKTSDL